jgi:hypothetical protein
MMEIYLVGHEQNDLVINEKFARGFTNGDSL